MNPIGLLMIAAGLFSAAGGIFNWEWFMSNSKARFVTYFIGRTGARAFYILLGLAIVVLGTLLAMGTLSAKP